MSRIGEGLCGAIVPVLLAAVFTGCSGGSNSGGGTTSGLTGHWKVWWETGVVDVGPLPLYLEDSGTVLDGAGVTGTINATTFTFTWPGVGGIPYTYDGTLSGNTAQGDFFASGSPLGTFRMEEFQPAGSLTVSGGINGEPTGINSTMAVGRRVYADQALTILGEVEVSSADADVDIRMRFPGSGLGVGTINTSGSFIVQVDYTSDTAIFVEHSQTGVVTVTQYDGFGFVGSFDIMLDSGDVITGTFDVAWDVDSYAL